MIKLPEGKYDLTSILKLTAYFCYVHWRISNSESHWLKLTSSMENCRKDYYQEGSHVYGELNVLEAFRKALTTWGRWVDANINPSKSMVFFRGYSASHFR